MTIYALFLCIQYTGECTMQGQARMTFAGPVPEKIYSVLGDCMRDAMTASGRPPDENDRFPIANGTMWYECRSRHIEDWKPAG